MENILKDENNLNYIKRYSSYNQYKEKQINNDLITLYYQFNHLKNIYRQGWLKGLLEVKNVAEIESVADHSWSVAMLAISVIEKHKLDLDITKCMKLAIVHELGEIYAGDFTPIENITKEEKHELEKKAVERVLDSISFENDFLELWEEYENQETEESQFIKEIDKLECILQASCYGLDISYMKNSINGITLPYLKDMLEELKDITYGNEKPFCIRNK